MRQFKSTYKIITTLALLLTVSYVQAQTPQMDAEVKQVTNTVNSWAASWSRQNVTEYLSHYSDTFKTPSLMTMEEWQELRHARLIAPDFIEVSLRNIEIEFIGTSVAKASFLQTYRSDRYGSESMKEMMPVRYIRFIY